MSTPKSIPEVNRAAEPREPVGYVLHVDPPAVFERVVELEISCGDTSVYLSQWNIGTAQQCWRVTTRVSRMGGLTNTTFDAPSKDATFEEARAWAVDYVADKETERLLGCELRRAIVEHQGGERSDDVD